MLPDRPEAREKFLCTFRVAKATHATLAFAGRLVAVLGPVIEPGGSFDAHVLHVRKLWDLSLGCRVAAQLIGDDLARNRARAQHTLEEAFGGGFITPLLHQDVEFGAMFVYRTPQQVRFASQRDEHLVEVPVATGLASRGFNSVSNAFAELVAPASDRLVPTGLPSGRMSRSPRARRAVPRCHA